MKNLKGKIAVITGSGSGIGEALALHLAGAGCHLALNDNRADRLEEVKTKCQAKGVNVYGEAFDVSDRKAFYQFADNVLEHFGAVDIVINNAGVALGKYTIQEVSIEDFEWIMGINLWGVIYGTKAFLPTLVKRSEAAVVNISSLFGITGVPFQGPYCTTKFGVRGFTEALRHEMRSTNVSVHVVHPGGVRTNIARDSRGGDETSEEVIKQFEKALIHPPEKAANIIVKAIKRKQSRILIGPEAHVMDAIVRVAPTRYAEVIEQFYMKQIEKKS